MKSSNWNTFRVTDRFVRGFTGHRWIPLKKPVTRSFDIFSDLCLNEQLSNQWRRRWFETLLRSLWRPCNGLANERWCYIFNALSHWLTSCLTLDRKRVQIAELLLLLASMVAGSEILRGTIVLIKPTGWLGGDPTKVDPNVATFAWNASRMSDRANVPPTYGIGFVLALCWL